MPIRNCQKCGLKVLIDESMMGTNPFYCQRCAATSKSSPVNPAVASEAPGQAAPAAAVPPPMAVAPPKGATVKITCPYCRANFSGKTPAKPAKGACPVCQKELVLLPDGGVVPAAGFDLAKWKAQQSAARPPAPAAEAPPPAAPPPDENRVIPSRIEARATKIRRIPPSIAVTSPQGAAPEDDALALPGGGDIGGETMLDMGHGNRPAATPPAKSEAEEAFPAGLGGETMLDMGHTGKPPSKPVKSELEEAFPSGLGGETMLDMGHGGRPASKAPPPLPSKPAGSEVEEAFPSGLGGETMLDMGHTGKPPSKPVKSELEEAFPSGLGGETMLDMGHGNRGPKPPPPAEAESAFPGELGGETMLDMGRPIITNTPEPASPPPPRPSRPPELRQAAPPPPPPPPPAEAETDEQPAPPVPEVKAVRKGPGRAKLVVSILLLLVPAGAAPFLWSRRDEPQVKDLLDRIGTVLNQGVHKLAETMRPAAPPPSPSPSPSPSPTPTPTPSPSPSPTPKESEEEKAARWAKAKKDLENRMTDLYLEIKKIEREVKSLDKDPTPAQKQLIQERRAVAAGKQKEFDELQKQYVKSFGSPFKPQDQ